MFGIQNTRLTGFYAFLGDFQQPNKGLHLLCAMRHEWLYTRHTSPDDQNDLRIRCVDWSYELLKVAMEYFVSKELFELALTIQDEIGYRDYQTTIATK